MYWRIKLEDENGAFWLEPERRPGERRWSEDWTDARVFTVEVEADAAAAAVRCRAAENPDWFPKVKVVRFIGIGPNRD